MPWPKGKRHSEESKRKSAEAHLGPRNGNWRGGHRVHGSIHNMLARRPKRGQCVQCGKRGRTDWACLLFAEGSGEPIYTRDPADYGERCRRCHSQLDRAMRLKELRARACA